VRGSSSQVENKKRQGNYRFRCLDVASIYHKGGFVKFFLEIIYQTSYMEGGHTIPVRAINYHIPPPPSTQWKITSQSEVIFYREKGGGVNEVVTEM